MMDKILLPSAVSCDGRRPTLTRSCFSDPQIVSTPPPSDDEQIASPLGTGLFNTCRTLQSFLGAQALSCKPVQTSRTPPVLLSPIQFQSSQRKFKVVKKQPPRGANKRRRDAEDDGSAAEDQESDKFSTPKRQCRVPLSMPLGLDRSDFEALEPSTPTELEPVPESEDNEWNSEDDRMLVELVLEKMKLSNREWNDCAMKLGKDKDSIGRRWKMLVGEGHVGIRRGRKLSRPGLEGAWT